MPAGLRGRCGQIPAGPGRRLDHSTRRGGRDGFRFRSLWLLRLCPDLTLCCDYVTSMTAVWQVTLVHFFMAPLEMWLSSCTACLETPPAPDPNMIPEGITQTYAACWTRRGVVGPCRIVDLSRAWILDCQGEFGFLVNAHTSHGVPNVGHRRRESVVRFIASC